MTKQKAALTEFEKATRAFIQWLDGNPSLSTLDLVSLDNHLQAAQMAVSAWKRRQISHEGRQTDHDKQELS